MCLDNQILNSYLDNELTEPWKSQVEEHLEWCSSCQKRMEELKQLKELTQKAVLEDSAIEKSKDRVLRYLENNILKSKKRTVKHIAKGLSSKKFFWPSLAAAITFCFCMIIFPGSKSELASVVPNAEIPVALSIDNVYPVRLSDNYTTTETLSKYSLEEILQYLDSEGYDVILRNKGITPIQGEVIVNEQPEIAKADFRLPLPQPFQFDLTHYNNFTFKAEGR